ncbi:MAG: glutamate--cysteine ligase [Verrucomicrobiae bacterium]|nr:glutamate--cysteine ligase [Verrucomicrobiae bacterium]
MTLPTTSFNGNRAHSLGVELELQLVDASTFALKSGVNQILEAMDAKDSRWIKPELMQCYVEINTEVCHTVSDVRTDLAAKLQQLRKAALGLDTRLFWAGTHPFSPWYEQQITPNDRYYKLVEKMQDTARRLVTYGMHVHVGVDTGDKAIMLVDRLLRYLPLLLSLSANSPFWNGRNTGLHSYRSKIMETLPAAGLPPLMRNWSEYLWVLNHSVETGFINSIREIWWDIRPHPHFGTVEVRICDMPPNLDDVIGITALIQCLVARLSKQIDEGVYQYDAHPMMVQQNKWKACRYGLTSTLVDPTSHQPMQSREMIVKLVDFLLPTAKELQCHEELEWIKKMVERPNGAERQIALYQETKDMRAVVETMIEENRNG